ncbi:MAG: GyrI-like domain-containing protein [Oscillospiraceae bacterium]
MAFDYKKEYKEFYMPPKQPGIVTVPSFNFLAVRGEGDPNQEGGQYKQAVELLYGIAYTLKMSYKGSHAINGFFEYVVPPLEGFWWPQPGKDFDPQHKEELIWISLIRLPDFVTPQDFAWALQEATQKKKQDFSKVEFFTHQEGLCVQCMHLGPYDNEPATVAAMKEYAAQNGYRFDLSDNRYHHEIYLSDPRKSDPAKHKTVLRYPIAKL